METQQRGFSLIELMVVVSIIMTLSAIAAPNLLRSKMAATEASAVGSLRALNTAAITYSTIYGGYPRALSDLGPATAATSTSADLIDSVLSSGTKTGYVFTYSKGATDLNSNVLTYSISAQPISPGVTGERFFFTDQSGIIRSNTDSPASPSSAPLG